tara:strand:- start:537 stop:770 length:234 start_codon:yes stop_codon:yes gene_type:complete
MKGKNMKAKKQKFNIGQYFTIQYYAKKHQATITRSGLWTELCGEFISKKGVPYLIYFDVDQNGYRTATNKWKVEVRQ